MQKLATAHWLVPASQFKGDNPLLPALVIPEVPELRTRHLGPKTGPFSFFLIKDVKRAASERWGSVQAAERERMLRVADARAALAVKREKYEAELKTYMSLRESQVCGVLELVPSLASLMV
jgi:hypothetical protein